MDQILLNNSIIIPPIGYGTFPLKEELYDAGKIAYQAGYRLYDTSDNYYNEEYLGELLKKNPHMMTESIIISKFSQPKKSKKLKECFFESKRKLGKIDIYLLHWPYPYLWEKQWKMMEELYIAKEVGGIGVCNFEIDKLQKLLQICRIKPIINQIERHPLFQQNDLVNYCKRNDIQVLSYAPTARQDIELYSSEILECIANKYQKTVNQIIMRWNVETGTVPIPSSKKESHIVQNYEINDFTLNDDEVEAINLLEKGKRVRYDPNKRFTIKQKAEFFICSLGI